MPKSKRSIIKPQLAIGTAVEFVVGQQDRPARTFWRLRHGKERKPAWGGVHRLSRHSYRWWAEGSWRARGKVRGTATTLHQAKAMARSAAGSKASEPKFARFGHMHPSGENIGSSLGDMLAIKLDAISMGFR